MQLCIVMRIRGSLGAFIHCIVENGPVTSNWAVVPTAKHQLWDLGAFPDQLWPGSSVNIHLKPSWRLLTPLEGNLEGPALASAGWIHHRDGHPPVPDHHTRTEVIYTEWKMRCPAGTHWLSPFVQTAPLSTTTGLWPPQALLCAGKGLWPAGHENRREKKWLNIPTPSKFIHLVGSIGH